MGHDLVIWRGVIIDYDIIKGLTNEYVVVAKPVDRDKYYLINKVIR